MPNYQSFLSGTNMVEFWENIRWFLYFVAPLVMIYAAVQIAMLLFQHVIPSIFGKEKKDDDEKDEYETYRY